MEPTRFATLFTAVFFAGAFFAAAFFVVILSPIRRSKSAPLRVGSGKCTFDGVKYSANLLAPCSIFGDSPPQIPRGANHPCAFSLPLFFSPCPSPPGPAAQPGGERLGPRAGHRTRQIHHAPVPGHKTRCHFVSADADSLTCAKGSKTPDVYQRTQITLIQTDNRAKSTLLGLGIGTAGGAAFGAAVGRNGSFVPRGPAAIALGAVGAVIGTVIGLPATSPTPPFTAPHNSDSEQQNPGVPGFASETWVQAPPSKTAAGKLPRPPFHSSQAGRQAAALSTSSRTSSSWITSATPFGSATASTSSIRRA